MIRQSFAAGVHAQLGPRTVVVVLMTDGLARDGHILEPGAASSAIFG